MQFSLFTLSMGISEYLFDKIIHFFYKIWVMFIEIVHVCRSMTNHFAGKPCSNVALSITFRSFPIYWYVLLHNISWTLYIIAVLKLKYWKPDSTGEFWQEFDHQRLRWQLDVSAHVFSQSTITFQDYFSYPSQDIDRVVCTELHYPIWIVLTSKAFWGSWQ